MKPEKLFILAFLAPCLLSHAQNSDPASKPPQTTAPGPAVGTEVDSGKPALTTAPGRAAGDATDSGKPALATTPSLAAGAAADTYVIGPSDTLTVTVWKEPALSSSLLVRPDGMISLPLLGDVLASGLTPLQLADQITKKLKKYVQDPNVSVVISQIHSKVIYLLGEVAKKGPIEMTSGMTLLEAISSGGGLTDYANTKKIYILRDESGTHQKIPVHYKDALKGNSALNLVLKPGDTIVVP
ncbi:MAG: polysaccharide biosynthesis/export family protein [Terracidiphilus sp.]